MDKVSTATNAERIRAAAFTPKRMFHAIPVAAMADGTIVPTRNATGHSPTPDLGPHMIKRPFRPGTDGDPDRRNPRFFENGSQFEPGHRMRVVVSIIPSGKKEIAVYNRHEQSFWIWVGSGWLDIGSDPVEYWTQLPPKPSRRRQTAKTAGGSLPRPR